MRGAVRILCGIFMTVWAAVALVFFGLVLVGIVPMASPEEWPVTRVLFNMAIGASLLAIGIHWMRTDA